MGFASGYEGFIAGFFYGITTVIVGQPLDTIKTSKEEKKKKSVNIYYLMMYAIRDASYRRRYDGANCAKNIWT